MQLIYRGRRHDAGKLPVFRYIDTPGRDPPPRSARQTWQVFWLSGLHPCRLPGSGRNQWHHDGTRRSQLRGQLRLLPHSMLCGNSGFPFSPAQNRGRYHVEILFILPSARTSNRANPYAATILNKMCKYGDGLQKAKKSKIFLSPSGINFA